MKKFQILPTGIQEEENSSQKESEQNLMLEEQISASLPHKEEQALEEQDQEEQNQSEDASSEILSPYKSFKTQEDSLFHRYVVHIKQKEKKKTEIKEAPKKKLKIPLLIMIKECIQCIDRVKTEDMEEDE